MSDQPHIVSMTIKRLTLALAAVGVLGAAGTISKPFSPKDLPEQLRAIWTKLP